MLRILRYALLPALLGGAAHAQILDRCNLTPDVDYLLVETFKRVEGDWYHAGRWRAGWKETRVAGPDWKTGHALAPIADHASLQEGKQWFQLPDDTPVYCEVNIRQRYRSDPETTDLIDLSVYSLPKDRWWGHERNQGVVGYLREMEQEWDRWSDNVVPTVNVSVRQEAHSWLTDYYANLEREVPDDPLADGDTPVSAAAVGEDHYLAVATSPAAGTRIKPGEPGYHSFGWHTESQHDAGLAAVQACHAQGGGSGCFSGADGKSLRGACVGVAIAKWRDRDEDPERTYVATSSSFRDVIARDLRSGCEGAAFAGKYEETVVEHSCEMVHVMCASDIVPAAGTP